MEAIFKNGETIGYVEKDGSSWFAYSGEDSSENEACFPTKRKAISYIKKEAKNFVFKSQIVDMLVELEDLFLSNVVGIEKDVAGHFAAIARHMIISIENGDTSMDI